jgi:hypothetical protein
VHGILRVVAGALLLGACASSLSEAFEPAEPEASPVGEISGVNQAGITYEAEEVALNSSPSVDDRGHAYFPADTELPGQPPADPAECGATHHPTLEGKRGQGTDPTACVLDCINNQLGPKVRPACNSHCGTHSCPKPGTCGRSSNETVTFAYTKPVHHDDHYDCSCFVKRLDCPCGCLM